MRRNRKGVAPILSDAQRSQILQSIQPVRKDEATLQRGNERLPILSVRRPAQATLLLQAVKLVKTCASRRNLETELPPALRINKSQVAGYLVAEPLAKYDPAAPDQYELKWDADQKGAHVDLLPVLQPRNMEVAVGFITEIPVSLESVGVGHFLFFHIGEAETRVEEEGPPRKKKSEDAQPELKTAASKQPKEK